MIEIEAFSKTAEAVGVTARKEKLTETHREFQASLKSSLKCAVSRTSLDQERLNCQLVE